MIVQISTVKYIVFLKSKEYFRFYLYYIRKFKKVNAFHKKIIRKMIERFFAFVCGVTIKLSMLYQC